MSHWACCLAIERSHMTIELTPEQAHMANIALKTVITLNGMRDLTPAEKMSMIVAQEKLESALLAE